MTTGTRWKRRLAVVLTLAIVAAVVIVAVVRPWEGEEPRPAKTLPTLSPVPGAVAPGVYLLGRTSPAAAYAVDTSDGLVLIDSGLEDSASSITAQLGELGLNADRLRAILLTHVHADHSLGARRLRAVTGAKVYAGRGDCPPLRSGGPREAFFSTFHMPDVATHPTEVDVELAGDETLAFGDARFNAIATPGHTPGSTCYLLERNGLRALFTGDVVQSLNPDTKGVLGTYSAYLPPLYRGNARDYLASLRRLRAIPAPKLILPGHPRMDDFPERPAVPRDQWEALLDRGIGEMERLIAHHDADGANFLDGTPRELLPGLHYLGDHGGSAIYCVTNEKGLFLFDAPGDAGLVGFLAARFQALGWEGRKIAAVLLTSAGGEATGGLAAVVKDAGCKVVAPTAAHDAVRKLVPEGTAIVGEADLEAAGWFDVRMISLMGRGVSPAAYKLRWAGKTVLVSGRIPTKVSNPAAEQLMRDVTGPGRNPREYLIALDRLREVAPDLWLPAVPVHGQNANLYDFDWVEVLESNRGLFLAR